MSKNTLTILFAGLITIITLAVIVNRINTTKETSNTFENKFKFEEVSTETVGKIEINHGTATIVLEKNGDDWQIENQKANSSQIMELLGNITQCKVLETSSTNPANHSTFEVDDATGTTFRFYTTGNNLLESFVVGKYAGARGTYIRKEGENEVYKVSTDLSSFKTKTTIKDWKEIEKLDEA